MATPFPRSAEGSEERARTVVGAVALVLGPPFLVLVLLAAKFQGLSDLPAWDQAQLARHLAAGEGFVTHVIRPLSLVFRADYPSHPDLYNAPAHPFVLSLFYRLRHPSDKMTAGAGLLLWLLSVWLTFLVAHRWFGPPVAAWATFFYGCNVAVLQAALGGLPYPWMALGVLLAVWLATPDPQGQETLSDWPGWHLVLVGLACALAVLTHYLLVTVALAVGVYLVFSQPRRGRALGWFLAGFLLPLLPWMIRNFRLVGSPFFSLFWYEFLANTATYPGESVWRTATLPPASVFFLWQHPLEVARKFFTGFQQFWEAGPGVAHPVIGFLFLAALVIETEDPWMEELRAVVAGSLALGVLGSCLFRPEPTLLLAWAPLLAILGATFLTEQLESRFKGISPTGRWKRRVVCLGTVGLIGFPLFYFLAVSRPGPAPQVGATTGTLQRLLPPAATVMTNRPGPVAWYGNRRAVWLCQSQEDWEILEHTVGPVEATYLLPGLTQMPSDPQREWWVGLALPRGVYQGLSLAPEQPPRGVLRVRR